MHLFKYFIVLILLSSCTNADTKESTCSKILNFAEHKLPQYGILKSQNGFLYVDVDDKYVYNLIPFLEKEGFEMPPNFGKKDLVGAHIMVASAYETNRHGIRSVNELGEKIDFTLKGCSAVQPPQGQGIDEVYFIFVDAPVLDQIRKKYGLPEKEYDYHIAIGVKQEAEKAA